VSTATARPLIFSIVRLGSVVYWDITASGSTIAVQVELVVCSAQILLCDETLAIVYA
jgi:hypothetical protein